MKKSSFLKATEFLRCPKCHAKLNLNSTGNVLTCKKDASHGFPVTEGIASFVKREEISPQDAKWVFEYDEMAERYDELVKQYDTWLGVNLHEEFLNLAKRVGVKPSQRVLDISTGTGRVFLTIEEAYPDVDLKRVGVDLSIGMLRVAFRKFEDAGIEALLFQTQVKELPFADDSFDIIIHSGGMNTYADIPATLKEWVRVLRPEGTLLIVDEGLSPTVRKTRRGLEIVKDNKLFGLQPPLEHLPPQLKNVELRWIARGTFYAINCQKLSKEELEQLETNGTEHIRISEMTEEYPKKLQSSR